MCDGFGGAVGSFIILQWFQPVHSCLDINCQIF
jgi:hypothetical protein